MEFAFNKLLCTLSGSVLLMVLLGEEWDYADFDFYCTNSADVDGPKWSTLMLLWLYPRLSLIVKKGAKFENNDPRKLEIAFLIRHLLPAEIQLSYCMRMFQSLNRFGKTCDRINTRRLSRNMKYISRGFEIPKRFLGDIDRKTLTMLYDSYLTNTRIFKT